MISWATHHRRPTLMTFAMKGTLLQDEPLDKGLGDVFGAIGCYVALRPYRKDAGEPVTLEQVRPQRVSSKTPSHAENTVEVDLPASMELRTEETMRPPGASLEVTSNTSQRNICPMGRHGAHKRLSDEEVPAREALNVGP